MSREAVEAIIGKAVVDSRFREALFADPEEALAGYELTEEEVVALKAIGAEEIESFAGALDERISKVVHPYDTVGGARSGDPHLLDPEAGRRGVPWDWV
jgi:hypothetical protein